MLAKQDKVSCRSAYPFAQLLQDVNLNQGLLMETLLVADDLDSHESSSLVVDASHDLSKAALAEKVNNLIPICEMVAKDYVVVASVVVVTEVSSLSIEVANMFLGVLRAAEVYLLVVDDFASLEDVQIDHLQSLCWRNTLLGCSTLAERINLARRVLEVFALRRKFLHLLVRNQVISVEIRVQVARSEYIGGALRSKHSLHGRQDR